MKVYKILNQKLFTEKLFIEEVFDNFLVTESEFVTEFTSSFLGRKNSPKENEDEFIAWKAVRPLALSVIKGNKLPVSFRVVLKLSSENTLNTLNALNINSSDETGLFINIKYENEELLLISGSSTTSFLISKELDTGFEKFLEKFLSKNEIEFEIL